MNSKLIPVAVLLLYLVTHVVGLDRLPCYFHSDEATPTVHAHKLVNDFLNGNWYIPPLFYQVAWNYNLCTTVYLQVPGVLFAEPSLEVTRGLSAIFSVGILFGVMGIARADSKMPWRWLPAIPLLCSSLWFLHSRTAFEVVAMVTTFALALSAYANYRSSGTLRTGIWCVVWSILSFHAYSAGQVLIPLTFLLLAVLDAPFHLSREQRFRTLGLLALGILLLLPYLHFRYTMSEILSAQLKNTNSPLLLPLPWSERLSIAGATYLHVLDPRTWFSVQRDNIIRHQFAADPALPLLLAPFATIGFFYHLLRWREPVSKVLLVAALTAPLPSVISSFSFLRSLTMLIPLSYWSAAGVVCIAGKLPSLVRTTMISGVLLFGVFCSASLLYRGLTDGCRWSSDYTLYGYQWGADPLFKIILPALYEEFPSREIWMSSTWAHSPETFREFYGITKRLPLLAPSDLGREKIPGMAERLYILSADDLAILRKDERLTVTSTRELLRLPNGNPGFYLASLAYSARFEQIVQETKEEELRMRSSTLSFDGAQIELATPGIDVGPVTHLVDGDPATLIRGARANPFRIILTWNEPSKEYHKVSIITSHHNNLSVQGTLRSDAGETVLCSWTKEPRGADGAIWSCEFSPAKLHSLELLLENPGIPRTERANIHINEIAVE